MRYTMEVIIISNTMDPEKKYEEQMAEIATKQKLGLGIKILLSVIVLGSLAAGMYAAISLSQ